MAMPIKPSDFNAVIPEQDDTLAWKLFLCFVRLPILLYKIHKYKWTAAGEITPEFEADICAAIDQCP